MMVDRDTMRSNVIPPNSDMPVMDGDVLVLGSDFALAAQTGYARYIDEHHPKNARPPEIDGDTRTVSLAPLQAVRTTLGILSLREVVRDIQTTDAERPLASGTPAPAIERQLDIFARQATAIGTKALEFYTWPRFYRKGYLDARRLARRLRTLQPGAQDSATS